MKTLLEYSNISQSEKKMEKDLTKKKKRFSPTLHRGVGIWLEKNISTVGLHFAHVASNCVFLNCNCWIFTTHFIILLFNTVCTRTA
jgi:hypothetical protein